MQQGAEKLATQENEQVPPPHPPKYHAIGSTVIFGQLMGRMYSTCNECAATIVAGDEGFGG